MMPMRRRWLILLGILVLLPLAALALLAAAFDPNVYKARVAEAARRATGRALSFNGPVTVSWGLSPTFEARDVVLANIEGGSRPEMMRIERVETRVSPLPLLWHSLYVRQLLIVHPDLLLETNARGEPNWRPDPARPASQAAAPEQGQDAGASIGFAGALRIENGTVTHRDGGRDDVLAVSQLEANAAYEDSPIRLALQGSYNGVPLALDGEVGSVARLRDPYLNGVWPVRLTLTAAGARANVAGSFTRPLELRGYKLKLDGAVPDLAALRPFQPSVPLPALRDIALSAQLADGGGTPRVSLLTLHAGAADLSDSWPGLSVTRLDVAAPRADDQPMRATAEGVLSGSPLAVSATFGSPSALLAGGPVRAPFPVSMAATLAGANLSLRGTVAAPLRLSGVDLFVRGGASDLALFSPLAQYPLPALKTVTFHGHVHDRDGSFANGMVLRDFGITGAQGELSGDLTIGLGPTPALQGNLTSKRMNADEIWAAFPPPLPPPPSDAAAPPPAVPLAPVAPAFPVAAEDQPAVAAPAWVIPDTNLPFDQLPRATADLRFKLASLVLGGVTYRDASGHLGVTNGRLQFDAAAAATAGQPMSARLSADASQASPPVAVSLRAPAVPLKPLVTALGLPTDASGTIEVDLELRGAGRTPHEIAAGARGHLGLASVDGRIGGRLLNALAGPVLRRAGVPGPRSGGLNDVRCFATRLEAAQGVASLRGLLLDTAPAYLDGTGSLSLSDETFALRLDAGSGGGFSPVPVSVTGPFRDPTITLDTGDATAGVKRGAGGGSAAGYDRNSPPGGVLDRFAPDRVASGFGQSDCLRQLAIARGGRPGPAPVYLATPMPPPLPAPLPIPVIGPYSAPLPDGLPPPDGPPPPEGSKPINLLDILKPKPHP